MNVRFKQHLGVSLLLMATLCVVVPVLLVIGLIVARGWSALSLEFIFSMPRDGMRAGGIFPAIAGTLYLVLG